MPETPQELIAGRYQIAARIGSGGMGEVFRARDAVLNRVVAIKVLPLQMAVRADSVDRFKSEAQSAARISHPNVVAVHDWGETDTTCFMVMEYVRGRNLREILSSRGPLEPAQACEILAQTLDGLAAAHAQGLVHRDIKPENLLLSVDGVVKVTDFGIARLVEARAKTSGLLGTVAYVAPEQIRGDLPDSRSDIYAAGCVFYELLTGSVPFRGDVAAVLHQHVTGRVPSPMVDAGEATEQIDHIVLKSTSPLPSERYATATEMSRDAKIALAVSSLAAPLTELNYELTSEVSVEALETIVTAPRSRRHIRPVWVLAVLLIALFAAAVYYFRPTQVPDLIGNRTDLARAELQERGLHVRVEGRASPKPADTVIEMKPLPNKWVFGRGDVTLVISQGPELTDVPDLKGKALDEAKSLIREARLRLGAITEVHDRSVTGTVVDQDPKPGKTESGDPVNLTISKGPEFVEVPNVSGKPIADAEAQLIAAGLTVVKEEVFNDAAPGNVVSQAPPPKSMVERGSSVTLKVSKGPEPFDMPDVKGKACSEAKSQLERLGLVVVVRSSNGACGSAKVAEQDPLPRARVRKGQEATLYIT